MSAIAADTEVSEALCLSPATLHHIALQNQKITYLGKKNGWIPNKRQKIVYFNKKNVLLAVIQLLLPNKRYF